MELQLVTLPIEQLHALAKDWIAEGVAQGLALAEEKNKVQESPEDLISLMEIAQKMDLTVTTLKARAESRNVALYPLPTDGRKQAVQRKDIHKLKNHK